MNKYKNFENIPLFNADESLIKNAYFAAEKNYTKNEILKILSEENEEIKPPAIFNTISIDNEKELNLFLSHLTNRDGRIRESISYILNELSPCSLFSKKEQFLILVDAICDINPNVSRNIISLIKKNDEIKEKISPFIIERTNKTLSELSLYLRSHFKENAEKSAKNHAKNKLTFNLYWLLEGIVASDSCDLSNEIIVKTGIFLDYTIREKTAEILSKMKNPPSDLLIKLKNDENIYVKNQLL